MAKELPYFQFEPAEYLTGKIQFCSFEAQGVFINICAIYWQRLGDITKEQLLKRYPENCINELLKDGLLKETKIKISINFLELQIKNKVQISKINSRNGKLSAEARKQKASQMNENTTTVEIPFNENPTNRREEKREDNKINKEGIFNSFKFQLLKLGVPSNLVEDFMKVRKNKKASDTETSFNKFMTEVKKSGKPVSEIVQICVEKDWKGFDSSWLNNEFKFVGKNENSQSILTGNIPPDL